MNLITKIGLFFVIVSAISCSENKNTEEEIKEGANNFLTYYYSQGFKIAKQYSDKATHKLLNKIKALGNDNYQDQYLEKIDKVELISEDSATVDYHYFNSNNKRVEEQILVIKTQRDWLVNIQNTNNQDFYKYVYDYSFEEVGGGVNLPLTNEEKVEIDLVVSSFIKQINHSKMVVGLLTKDGLNYYDIPNIENFDESYNWFWSDLSTMGLYASLRFDNEEALEEVEYYISGIDSKNDLGTYNKIERLLKNEYGKPYNLNEEKESPKSLRWFIKGANNQLELLNNEDGTISIKVRGDV